MPEPVYIKSVGFSGSGNVGDTQPGAFVLGNLIASEGTVKNSDRMEEEKIDNVLELISELNLSEGVIKRLANILQRLSEELDGSKDYVRIWLTSPHPDFGGKPPIFYFEEGKIEVVESLLEAIEMGQPG